MNTKYILIEADTNDADYISNVNPISDEDIEILRPIIEVIKNCKQRHNWTTSECNNDSPNKLYKDLLTVDQIDIFSEYAPYGEYGIHTIESIEIIQKLEKLM